MNERKHSQLDKVYYCSASAGDARPCNQYMTNHCLKERPARKRIGMTTAEKVERIKKIMNTRAYSICSIARKAKFPNENTGCGESVCRFHGRDSGCLYADTIQDWFDQKIADIIEDKDI